MEMAGQTEKETDELEKIVVPLESLRRFTVRCLENAGALPAHAEVMAELIVSADHRGHYSHGMNRIEFYLFDLKNGHTSLDQEPEIIQQTPATALVDGNNCLGPVVGKYCMDIAIEKAKKVGIGWGLAFCNTSPNMIHTRAKTRTLGTNPISVAAKGNNNEEFVLDMATTTVAQGKVEIKHRLGQNLPEGWAVDRNGKSCTDTQEVLYHGGLTPLGGFEETSGYKGYGLGLMVELFCGILSGSNFGTNVRDWTEHSSVADLGQCFAAIDPKAFAPGFEDRLSSLIHQCRDQRPAEGESEILVPGDPEKRHMELCEKLGGIPYHPKQIEFADYIAQKYNTEPLSRL